MKTCPSCTHVGELAHKCCRFFEEEWSEAIVLFDVIAKLAWLPDSPPDSLAGKRGATHPDHTKRSSSWGAVPWQTLVHNSHHIGQVVMLRRTFGAWPPKDGGDSW